MRVLVVDDQELNRTLLQFLLQDEGYEVIIATNGEEALQRFDGNHQLLSVMMKKFILQFETLEQQVQILQTAGDLEELAYYTHNLKGTSDTLALTHLSHCADTVTVSINKNKIDTLNHQLDYLGKVWRESKESMEQYLESQNV